MSAPAAATAPSAAQGETVLTVRGASKRFGVVTALEDIDLDVRRGEVLALLGDNGAGKSTLIKCLNGVHRLDSGVIEMDGVPVAIRTPADARALGVETVYQDLALFDNLRPTDNFYAGRELAGPCLAAALAARAQAPADDRCHARGARAPAGVGAGLRLASSGSCRAASGRRSPSAAPRRSRRRS